MTTFHKRARRPYQQQQSLCHYPTIKSQDLWQQHSYKHDTIAEPLYRLRLSALNNKQNRPDCPSRIFVRCSHPHPHIPYPPPPPFTPPSPKTPTHPPTKTKTPTNPPPQTDLPHPRNLHQRRQRNPRLLRRFPPPLRDPIPLPSTPPGRRGV